MRAPSLTRICWFVLRASTALVLTIAPYHLTFDGTAKVVPADVRAEDDGGESEGGSGSGSGGSGSNSGGGGGNSGVKQVEGCAAATAVRKSSASSMRKEAFIIRS